MSKRPSDKKRANGLVALGSAAVLAVYSAGFVKTKAAAERLQALESRVRPGMTVDQPAALPSLPVSLPAIETARPQPTPETPSAPAPHRTAPPPDAGRVAAQPQAPAPVEAVPVEPPHETKAEPASLPAPPPSPAPAPEPVAIFAPPPPAHPAPAAPAQPVWKDGTWTGSGSARHGTMQASVVVENGRITSARIDQCRMRYPCYMIDRLVPQVAERGTPEKIDWVSGATESSNVFYWALMDALNKAK